MEVFKILGDKPRKGRTTPPPHPPNVVVNGTLDVTNRHIVMRLESAQQIHKSMNESAI